jgi:hypothetical protein
MHPDDQFPQIGVIVNRQEMPMVPLAEVHVFPVLWLLRGYLLGTDINFSSAKIGCELDDPSRRLIPYVPQPVLSFIPAATSALPVTTLRGAPPVTIDVVPFATFLTASSPTLYRSSRMEGASITMPPSMKGRNERREVADWGLGVKDVTNVIILPSTRACTKYAIAPIAYRGCEITEIET